MRLLSLSILFLTVAGCQGAPEDPMSRLQDDEAGAVARRAIEAAGGWDAWAASPTMDYQKTITFYDSTGAQTRRVRQHHQYRLQGPFRARIAYTDDDGRDVLLVYDGDDAGKWVDGERATAEDDVNQAWNSTFGSHYVMSMPFKLTDPGTRLVYAGRDTLDGVAVDAVRVEYAEGAGSAAGMHTWTYYVAADDGRMVANHLRFGPGPDDFDLTVYGDIREVGGLRIPMRRESFHSNAAADRLGRASSYLNEVVRLDAPLDDAVFAFPR